MVEEKRQTSSHVGVRIGKCVNDMCVCVCVSVCVSKVLKCKEKYSSTVFGSVKHTT